LIFEYWNTGTLGNSVCESQYSYIPVFYYSYDFFKWLIIPNFATIELHTNNMSITIFIDVFNANLEYVSTFIAAILGYVGISIILYGSAKGIVEFVFGFFDHEKHIPHIRIELAKHLSLGLEFFVGKDMIGTIVNPSWDELGKLGAIIALRTVIALFLDYELKKMEGGDSVG